MDSRKESIEFISQPTPREVLGPEEQQKVLLYFNRLIALIVMNNLCWCPFILDGLKDAKHFCSQCNNYIGRYHRPLCHDKDQAPLKKMILLRLKKIKLN
ncbi:hypothetical protein Mgra_00005586 [Meloidogyne graminicola]|uniref:LITAF domain-containing protein n=1 Tax=Meloidogyne graminicola TaxID=189291 RepID=A0A8S9ZNI5_9BILA|nr:hypothetical protein Mgra_00005586 [Meloidogyne graminicola]